MSISRSGAGSTDASPLRLIEATIGTPATNLTPSTRIVDAGGATIVPGLHDSHGLFVALGAGRQTLDLRGTTSYDQIVELVRRRTAAVPRGQSLEHRPLVDVYRLCTTRFGCSKYRSTWPGD